MNEILFSKEKTQLVDQLEQAKLFYDQEIQLLKLENSQLKAKFDEDKTKELEDQKRVFDSNLANFKD